MHGLFHCSFYASLSSYSVQSSTIVYWIVVNRLVKPARWSVQITVIGMCCSCCQVCEEYNRIFMQRSDWHSYGPPDNLNVLQPAWSLQSSLCGPWPWLSVIWQMRVTTLGPGLHSREPDRTLVFLPCATLLLSLGQRKQNRILPVPQYSLMQIESSKPGFSMESS